MFERLSPLSKSSKVHVVSYNVLSSSLSRPSYFTHCTQDNLSPSRRYKKIVGKLQEQVKKNSIICLQEVSMLWAGHLHSFFQKQGYHFISSQYSKKWQGYMGCALAFPNSEFSAEKVEVIRVSDTKIWPDEPELSLMDRLSSLPLVKVVKAYLFGNEREPENHWNAAQHRSNTMILARLKTRSEKRICIGTYHMPCMFWAPKVMTIHTALALQKLQDFSQNDPCVMAGDFNFKPSESCYQLATKGMLDSSDKNYPAPFPDNEPWKPDLKYEMKSAYADFSGNEPDFTNYAQVKDDPVFIETLDYIFCSPQMDVVDVVELPHRNDTKGPLPNDHEPSDHILIGATFLL